MSQPFVGQVISVGFGFAPTGWQLCDGSLLSISNYQALYALIGTTYGGDGVNTFAVPDLRGHAPLSIGTGLGLPPYVLGQVVGSENVTLTANQVGAHSHNLLASAQNGSASNPAPALALGQNAVSQVPVYGPPPSNTTLAPAAIGGTGGSTPHENRQPYLAVNYIISLFGVFPPRS
jgi:microcystin-dependent protein